MIVILSEGREAAAIAEPACQDAESTNQFRVPHPSSAFARRVGDHDRHLTQQFGNNPRRRTKRGVNLRLIFAAGLGDLGFPAA